MNPFRTFIRLICLLLPALMWASESRINAMGGVGAFTYDPINVRFFPGALLKYPNLFIGDFAVRPDSGNVSAGVHLSMGRRAAMALYLNRSFPLPTFVQSYSNYQKLNGSELYFCAAAGSNRLGLRIAAAVEKSETPGKGIIPVPVKETARYFEVGGGISGDEFDMGAYYILPKLKSDLTGSEATWEGNGYGFNGRLMIPAAAGLMLVPAISATLISATVESVNSGNVIETEQRVFSAGLGLHYLFYRRNLLIVGVEFYGFEKEEIINTTTSRTDREVKRLPSFYLGGETRVAGWLYLRLGAAQKLQRTRTFIQTLNAPDRVSDIRKSDFDVFAGMGVRVGSFLLDLHINDQSLVQGAGIFGSSATEDREDFLTRLSVTFSFGH